MKEYIEKDLVMDALLHEQYGYCCEDAINNIPAADVVEVRHGAPIRHFMRFCNSDGEVIREIMDGWECPFCHNTGAENYCPSCGAKMDGGADDGNS